MGKNVLYWDTHNTLDVTHEYVYEAVFQSSHYSCAQNVKIEHKYYIVFISFLHSLNVILQFGPVAEAQQEGVL